MYVITVSIFTPRSLQNKLQTISSKQQSTRTSSSKKRKVFLQHREGRGRGEGRGVGGQPVK
ncbi:hypothetical protein INR49_013866 [Caranx melampygus]|nr:hypothetical protein INR49_013866 [Caranx melampygus]